MARFVLYAIVCAGGAAVLALEILGTRVLGPFYGVSLFVWSALITVTLLALSIGYTLGGRLADRRPTLAGLAWIPGAAGLWTLGLPWLRDPLLVALEPLGLRAGVLLAATVLFAVPLTLLGMIGPYAIRLRAERMEEVGRTAGRIYALSTVASVASALVTGFWAIPILGVRRLLVLVGAVLVAVSLAALLARHRSAAARAAAVVVLLLAPGAAWLARSEMKVDGVKVVALAQSPYGEVRVIEQEDERLLLIDGGVHTRVDSASRRTTFRYVAALKPLMETFAKPGRALVIGLGGGSAARFLAADGWTVDAVDVDPVVADFAKRYFGLQTREATVAVKDARRYLESYPSKADLIVVDAYGSASMPFHLASTEFFALVKSRLAPGGVVAVNVYAGSWKDRLVRSVAATLDRQFTQVWALPTQEPPNNYGNVVVAAADRPIELVDEDALPRPEDHLQDPYDHWLTLAENHGWDNRFRVDVAGSPVLTDDRSPVDLWFEPVHEASRRDLFADFGRDALLW